MEKRNSRILLKILGFNKKYENYVKKEVFSVLLTKRR